MNSSFLSGLLLSVPQILFFIFLIAGIVVGAVKMDVHPQPAKWVVSGFTLMLVAKIVTWIGAMAAARNGPIEGSPIMGAVTTMAIILNMMGLAMLIVAAFSDRSTKNQKKRAAV